MSGRWPLGPEVRRTALAGGAMLYDASRAGNSTGEWFDPGYWRARGEVEGVAQGRGTTLFVRTGARRMALRHYRRGGMVAALLGDRYFWRGEALTRPFAEWQLTYHLHRAGLPVPAPIAARYLRRGSMYTGDILTERIPDTESLASRLQRGPVPLATWVAIGRCIRRFHELGVHHADLNAHNVLLGRDDAVYLIDFDRGTLRRPGLWCDGNLVRLRRSLEKITYALPPGHITETDWHGLLGGYRETPAGARMAEPGA